MEPIQPTALFCTKNLDFESCIASFMEETGIDDIYELIKRSTNSEANLILMYKNRILERYEYLRLEKMIFNICAETKVNVPCLTQYREQQKYYHFLTYPYPDQITSFYRQYGAEHKTTLLEYYCGRYEISDVETFIKSILHGQNFEYKYPFNIIKKPWILSFDLREETFHIQSDWEILKKVNTPSKNYQQFDFRYYARLVRPPSSKKNLEKQYFDPDQMSNQRDLKILYPRSLQEASNSDNFCRKFIKKIALLKLAIDIVKNNPKEYLIFVHSRIPLQKLLSIKEEIIQYIDCDVGFLGEIDFVERGFDSKGQVTFVPEKQSDFILQKPN